MDRVGNRGRIRHLLDDPVCPYSRIGDLDDVQICWVACVARHDVLHGWIIPHNVHGCGVERPQHQVLAVCDDTRRRKLSAEGFHLILEGTTVDRLFPIWYCDYFRTSILRWRWARVSGCIGCLTSISEQGASFSVAAACTVACRFGSKVVCAGRLVGCEDNIVPLPDGKQDPVLIWDWFDGDKVSSDDRQSMAIQLETEEVVCRSVDDPQAMFLAGLDSNLSIVATTISRDASAVDQDVVRCGSRPPSLSC